VLTGLLQPLLPGRLLHRCQQALPCLAGPSAGQGLLELLQFAARL
jgi:hypothetical protein